MQNQTRSLFLFCTELSGDKLSIAFLSILSSNGLAHSGQCEEVIRKIFMHFKWIFCMYIWDK